MGTGGGIPPPVFASPAYFETQILPLESAVAGKLSAPTVAPVGPVTRRAMVSPLPFFALSTRVSRNEPLPTPLMNASCQGCH